MHLSVVSKLNFVVKPYRTCMQINSSVPDDAPVPGIYKHYKGNLYQVVGMARHSETEEWLVVYQALYAEKGFWTRPLSIWLEPVNQAGGNNSTSAVRFSLVTPNQTSLEKLTSSN